jgi:hypothetical protein
MAVVMSDNNSLLQINEVKEAFAIMMIKINIHGVAQLTP